MPTKGAYNPMKSQGTIHVCWLPRCVPQAEYQDELDKRNSLEKHTVSPFLTSGNSRAVKLPASDLLLLATPIHLLKRPGLYPIGGPNRAIKPILCIHCLDCLLCILNFAGATISLTAVLPLFSSVELIPVCLPPKRQVLHVARICEKLAESY